MKTKLTLTVRKSIIDSAKRVAKKRNMSLFQLFEEIFSHGDINPIKTGSQKAAERLLASLSKAKSITTKDDKTLLRSHVARKFP